MRACVPRGRRGTRPKRPQPRLSATRGVSAPTEGRGSRLSPQDEPPPRVIPDPGSRRRTKGPSWRGGGDGKTSGHLPSPHTSPGPEPAQARARPPTHPERRAKAEAKTQYPGRPETKDAEAAFYGRRCGVGAAGARCGTAVPSRCAFAHGRPACRTHACVPCCVCGARCAVSGHTRTRARGVRSISGIPPPPDGSGRRGIPRAT